MMKKTMLALGLVTALTGCSVSIKESNFISQDESVTVYTNDFVENLNARTPHHEIKPISIQVNGEAVVLHGLHFDHANTKDTILYIPGNGMSVEKSVSSELIDIVKYDYDIVVFDRRGLGASNGTATISTLISDAQLSYEFSKSELGAEKLIVHGFSLGSFVAAQVAKSKPIDGLVMQGSATNVADWIDEAIPWYKKMLVDVQVDDVFFSVNNAQVLSDYYQGPLLVIGGGKDKQTPVSLSHRLYDASQSIDKQIVISEEAGHYKMFDNKQVRAAYDEFLNKI
ncbi:alpha/beta fold hydrolase [Pseudoalteromonas sp. Of7M-16]|uniref:alpha/beta hydrolase n=1 Tax=Pseudoalteromonas sp. Of7M-16 TaxID=2917756 RepID=UPI001EF6AFA9|nr:alpha/beta fold hydrolase [Pseudoalteromonas sp. Of7M-16]MCG7551073.1 alpha/beta hydrolase [Pseudoalteromonas sp. Of7M-16]